MASVVDTSLPAELERTYEKVAAEMYELLKEPGKTFDDVADLIAEYADADEDDSEPMMLGLATVGLIMYIRTRYQ